MTNSLQVNSCFADRTPGILGSWVAVSNTNQEMTCIIRGLCVQWRCLLEFDKTLPNAYENLLIDYSRMRSILSPAFIDTSLSHWNAMLDGQSFIYQIFVTFTTSCQNRVYGCASIFFSSATTWQHSSVGPHLSKCKCTRYRTRFTSRKLRMRKRGEIRNMNAWPRTQFNIA